MCIAIVSPAGVKCPTLDTLKTCFLNNDDGAGWAYPLPNGRGVKIMKGFMTWKDFQTHGQSLVSIMIPKLSLCSFILELVQARVLYLL